MNIIPRIIDVSHYDDVEDGFAGAVRAGIWGVINKVSEGYGGQDASFNWRRGPAKDKGLLYGGYHFIRPGNVTRQADWFLYCVGDPTGLLLALDYEDDNVSESSARLFCDWIHDKTGRWPALYGGSVIKDNESDFAAHASFWKNVPLWLSHYNAHPSWPTAIWDVPFLWQYTGDGMGPGPHGVPGIIPSSGLDMNSYLGTRDQLVMTWMAPSLPSPSLTPPVLSDVVYKVPLQSGKASWYSQFRGKYIWRDTGDAPNSNALMVPDDCQGVSYYSRGTLGKWFEIHAPNGAVSIEQQTDIGPSPGTGRKIDISAVCAERLGYAPDYLEVPNAFPTDAVFSWRPASPPAQVADLSPREQAVKWLAIRQAVA